MLKVNGIAILVLGLSCGQASAQECFGTSGGGTICTPSGGNVLGTSTGMGAVMTFTAVPNNADIRDVVLHMRDDRLVLIRRVNHCTDVVAVLRTSADILKAECFK